VDVLALRPHAQGSLSRRRVLYSGLCARVPGKTLLDRRRRKDADGLSGAEARSENMVTATLLLLGVPIIYLGLRVARLLENILQTLRDGNANR